jgi:SAM-dependent methyltransferase
VNKTYVHYGCGLSAPVGWRNFDVSLTLRFQKIPLVRNLFGSRFKTLFPENVQFGDIIKGLPFTENSCDGIYCSHVLEHLSLIDFRRALSNTYKILKKGGVFRCVVPDLEYSVREYIRSLEEGNNLASIQFLGENTLLGTIEKPAKFRGFLHSYFGNAHHLWMWDKFSLSEELKRAGFSHIRPCEFNDCEDNMFLLVEDPDRFKNSVAIECTKS